MATSVGTHPYQYILADLGDAANIQTALKQFYYGNTGLTPTVGQGIYGAIYNTFNSPTIAGTVTLSSTTAATLAAASAFQIGPTSGVNLVASPAIIQARNNGSASALNLNTLGGNISLGNSASTITIVGNLVVSGDTTTINTATLDVEDIEIVLGNVASPSNATANGGGIRLEAGTDVDKTITWDSANANWTSSENLNIASGKVFRIGGTTEVLSSTKVLGRTPGGTAAGDIATIDATQTLTNKSLSDTTTFFVDSADVTKKLNINVTGTTGITGTITSAFTTAKTITLPDITGTALVTAGTTATAGYFDTGTTAPSATTRLNYGGYLYATRMYGDQFNSVTGTGATAGLFSDVTTGSVGMAVNAQTIGIGSNTTTAQTINIGTGANSTGVTKTLNIGTGAGTGGTTVVNIGGNPAVSASTITLNGTTTASLSSTSSAVTQAVGDRYTNIATTEYVINQIAESTAATLFGFGYDGSYTLNASQAAVGGLFTKSGNVFTLLKTAYFQDLNIASGYTLNPGGFAFFVAGTLTLGGANAISNTANNGTAGGSSTGGTPGSAGIGTGLFGSGYQTTSAATNGGSGGAVSTVGSNGGNATSPTVTLIYSNTWRQRGGGAGGTGGNGTYAGGAGGTTIADNTGSREWRYPIIQFMNKVTEPLFVPSGTSLGLYMNASGTGGGGGGGVAGGGNAGAGGGGGGQSNTGAFIMAKQIVSSGTGNEISFIGGNGGNGGNGVAGSSGSGGGGGGAGGQGGFVYLVAGEISGGFTGSAINVSGGAGGSAGTGTGGIYTPAVAGRGGVSGTIAFAHLSKGTMYIGGLVDSVGSTAGTYTMPINI